jgi:hypothetical protein
VANHSSTLAYNITNSDAAGGTAMYLLKVPNFFPKDGFYLGALGNHVYTLRIRTNSLGAVDSGTGVLALTNLLRRFHLSWKLFNTSNTRIYWSKTD